MGIKRDVHALGRAVDDVEAPLRPAWRGPGDQRSFSLRLSKNFTHDQNNGRPRFLNVRAKTGKPNLRVVI